MRWPGAPRRLGTERRRAGRDRRRRAPRRARRVRTRPRGSHALAGEIDDDIVVLPASPDGRDLAPRLAHVLGRPLLAGAIEVDARVARLARRGGLELHDVAVDGPVVATLQPGVRGVVAGDAAGHDRAPSSTLDRRPARDATVVEVLPPDVTTMDLAEADRIVGGGAGLDGAGRFSQLADVAGSLGASMGATRVITDRGWVAHERQIGTTGVVVDPDAVRRPRHQRRRAAHRRPRHARPHRQRQHRPALPDDADGRPRRRRRRQRRPRRARRALVRVAGRAMTVDVDVVVVGAGPAGSCAATVLARAGRSVLLLERGPFAGSKNMYGGVVYPRILDGLHPQWWEEAPVQRWITRRSTMVLTDTQALTVDFRTEAWGRPPYNGATAFRPDFDHWLAGKAEADGAQLVTSTTVDRPAPRRRRQRSPACAPTGPTATSGAAS